MKNILVLGIKNSCRSQMMHGYLAQMAADKARIYSAGLEPTDHDPRAVEAMREDGVDISQHTSNHVDDYRGIEFEVVLSISNEARDRGPSFPGRTDTVYQNFEDPAKAKGNESEIRAKFTQVRDQIKDYAAKFENKYIG